MSVGVHPFHRVPLWLALFVLLPACFSTRAKDWLASKAKSGSPEINIAGLWTNSDWGDSYFQQDGGRVSGTLGGYPVRGVVNQRAAYLVIYTSSRPAYTAVLWFESQDILVGSWARKKIIHARADGEAIILHRLKE